MHISLAAETLFFIGQFPVTNSILTSWIVTLILIVTGILTGLNYKKLPSGLQTIWEMAYEAIEDFAVSVAGEKGKNYVPLVVTMFIFILFSNWVGLIPGVGSVGINELEHGEKVFIPFIRSATADINTTLCLALISVVTAQFLGIKASGLLGHLKHFANPLEIVGENCGGIFQNIIVLF
ncbi:F0F1 ATP synthase subunit A [Candidatus Microgenomates bacterium]|nr:F0F1 ATP synthase subunit A [Candidatus Microgenomates bacterium]